MASNTEDTVNVEGTKGPDPAEEAHQVEEFRRYLATLADATPTAPPNLDNEALRRWQYQHLRTSSSISQEATQFIQNG